MKTSSLAFLSAACLFGMVLPRAAIAYEYRYHTGVPSVELDLSQLEAPASDGAATSDMDDDADNTVRAAPGKPMPALKPAAVQKAVPAPTTKKLQHPFFTATSIAPLAETPAAPAPIAAPVSVPQPVHAAAAQEAPVAPAPALNPPAAAPAAKMPSAASNPPAPPEQAPAPAIKSEAPKETAAPLPNLTAEEKSAAPLKPTTEAAVPSITAPLSSQPVSAQAASAQPESTGDNMKKAVEDINKGLSPTDGKPAVASAEKPAESKPVNAAVPTMSDLTVEFSDNSSMLSNEGQKKLDGIATQMQDNQGLRAEIRAFAKGDSSGGSSAKRMALSRALTIRSYLTDKGVKPVRLDVHALGSETDRMPIDRVDLVFVR